MSQDQQPPSDNKPPPHEGWFKWIDVVKGLSLTNVLVIALLVAIIAPVYVIYRALNDEGLMGQLLSQYEEMNSQQIGCALRHARARGGEDLWGISAGFAYQGADRWFVNVVLNHSPTNEELHSHCETLKLIADKMLDSGDDANSNE